MAQAYEVVDAQTSKVVAAYDDMDSAVAYADRRDAAYGAVRYTVRRNYERFTASEFETFMVRVRAEAAAR